LAQGSPLALTKFSQELHNQSNSLAVSAVGRPVVWIVRNRMSEWADWSCCSCSTRKDCTARSASRITDVVCSWRSPSGSRQHIGIVLFSPNKSRRCSSSRTLCLHQQHQQQQQHQ